LSEERDDTVHWRFGRRSLDLGRSVKLMGVVNVTPDSFSDGGRFFDPARAIAHALALAEAGADLLDIGGESTRPGAEPVPVEAELARVLPVLEAVRPRTDAVLSIDTRKPEVAHAALAAGAEVVNDVTALADPAMRAVVATSGAGAVLMHMRGEPRTMQSGDLRSDDIVAEVARDLGARLEAAVAAGVAREAICLDPGLGFGKTLEQNYELIDGLGALVKLGQPVLVGASRKSFIGRVTGRGVDAREWGTAAACAWAVARGAHVLRVHDVAAMADVARVAEALRAAGRG
jgi:dihydropteroate synthase